MHILNAHSSTIDSHYQVNFTYQIKDNLLSISFEVISKTGTFNTSNQFDKKGIQNWGMWEYDVLEVFLSTNKQAPYLELQLSPLNQKLALIIKEPRKTWNYPEDWDDFFVNSKVNDNKWSGTIEIELNKIPNFKEDSSVWANVFGILGSPQEFYAWNPNPEESPDHHRPELFKELVC